MRASEVAVREHVSGMWVNIYRWSTSAIIEAAQWVELLIDAVFVLMHPRQTDASKADNDQLRGLSN